MIEPPRTIGVAPQQTPNGEHGALGGAVDQDRFFRVLRTGRVEAASGRPSSLTASSDRGGCRRSGWPGPASPRPHRADGGRSRRPPRTQELFHLGHQVVCRGAPDGLSSHQDRVGCVVDLRVHQSPCFPQDASGTVALHRTPDVPGGDDREAPLTGREEHYHPRALRSPALPVDTLDLTCAHGASMCGGEASPALAAARRDDRTAGSGPHAQPEAVTACSPAVVGLVGALALGHRASFLVS